MKIIHFDEIVQVDGQHFKDNDQMLSKHKLINLAHNVLFIVGIIYVQSLNEFCLDEALLVQSFFITQYFECNVLFGLVIDALQHDAERPLA